jgi:hypothetical protein
MGLAGMFPTGPGQAPTPPPPRATRWRSMPPGATRYSSDASAATPGTSARSTSAGAAGWHCACVQRRPEGVPRRRSNMRAMPSTEAQRTLVKSPPELWAELCDPASLARHLGELGEIRIVRVEPEQSVEWEAPDATGAIQLKPSGWGTRVTLTVVREAPEPALEPEAVLEPEPEPDPVPEPEASSAPDPVAEESPEPQPATRRSRLFARLFRRRRVRTIELEQPPAVEAEAAQPGPEPEAAQPGPEPEPAQPEPTPEAQEPPPNLAAELAAELARIEEAMAEQDAALLTAVLDRLGAAHHRPFSRG